MMAPLAFLSQLLAGDTGALVIALLFLGIAVGFLWALRTREPRLYRSKYE